MPRALINLAAASAVAIVSVLPSIGTAGPANPNWFNDPTEGPSPNTDHVVGNTDGGECQLSERSTEAAGVGGVGLGGIGAGFVQVVLKTQDDAGVEAEEEYSPDENADWGGEFPIPENLEPGVYPLEAYCRVLQPPGEIVTLFTYTERSYTVVEATEEPDPVEAEVTLTG